jgi:hypothetical protein
MLNFLNRILSEDATAHARFFGDRMSISLSPCKSIGTRYRWCENNMMCFSL